GLAGAVRAEDAEDFATVDGERDVSYRDRVPVALAQLLYRDDWHASSLAWIHPDRIDRRARLSINQLVDAGSGRDRLGALPAAGDRRVDRADLGGHPLPRVRLAGAIQRGRRVREPAHLVVDQPA